ncbi:hypothetical protein F5B17DRAFT_284729 [Nemania serpens]|nr:hypothetical protein F5B17DRAFT_284729 [Nemania serpens]
MALEEMRGFRLFVCFPSLALITSLITADMAPGFVAANRTGHFISSTATCRGVENNRSPTDCEGYRYRHSPWASPLSMCSVASVIWRQQHKYTYFLYLWVVPLCTCTW